MFRFSVFSEYTASSYEILAKNSRMKVAYIHSNKKTGTGAHYINDLIVSKLRQHHVDVRCFYPHFLLTDTPINFKGINNILFFYSLLEKRNTILKCDIIQGTTYTPLAFMQFSIPVVSHFGSTTIGFLKAVPRTSSIEKECAEIFYALKKWGVIHETDLKTLRPLNDIVSIEQYAAEKADWIVATSEIVKQDLIGIGIRNTKIEVIHNAIEDYWFETEQKKFQEKPVLVFLGRIGEDAFTLKIKWLDRLIHLYQQFPEVQKLSIVMSRSKKLITWMRESIPNHQLESNIIKTDIPKRLSNSTGGILLVTSRYEGFSLSLIEGMSQWLVPVSFRIGVAPEVIENGENGFLVNNLQEAEEKIRLLIENTELREKLSQNARASTLQFRADILAKKMIELYEKIRKKSA